MKFWANAIALYGGTSANHGMFSVTLDDAAPVELNASAPADQPRYEVLLVRNPVITAAATAKA